MPPSDSGVTPLLHDAVTALGGQERPGQVQMAEAVATALPRAEHLLVQAGTGTGKSLAYLVPACSTTSGSWSPPPPWRCSTSSSSATSRGSSRRSACAQVDTSYAVLKGRSNYACLHRIREGVPDDQGALVDVPVGLDGREVLELRDWAEKEAEDGGTGERDNAPRHTDREWRQVSVNHRECLGAAKCPFGAGVLRRAAPRRRRSAPT